jgi:hypothetical protein
MMNGSPLAVRKLIVGIASLGCLASAAGLFCFAADGAANPATAVTMRLGLMLAALWLALPSQGEGIGWRKAMPVILAVVVVLAFVRNWRFLVYAIPAAIIVGVVLAFLRPRSKRGPRD